MPRILEAADRKRAYKPKTRSGCKTCKIRRVKCDEAKPYCDRCLKYGYQCDGFDRNPHQQLVSNRPLAPCLVEGLKSAPILLSPLVAPGLSLQSQAEYQYFRTFQTETVAQLTGPFDSPLWERIVLQECSEQGFARDAVLAIAALHLSLGCSVKPCRRKTGHHVYAFSQFGKALHGMKQAMSAGGTGIRTALIGCLLVFCFESLQGNMDSAISHARSGYKLLDQRQIIPRSKRMPDLIEDDLVHAFSRLDLQVMTVVNRKPADLHQCQNEHGAPCLEAMPSVFTTFTEAHRYWSLTMRKTAKFIHKAVTAATSKSSPFSQSLPETDNSSRVAFGSSIQTPFPQDVIPQPLRQEQSKCAAELHRWQEAFRPFRYPPNSAIKPAAISLYSHCLTTQILLASLLHTTECAIDIFLPEFKSIVSLARSFLKQDPPPARQPAFSIDFGILTGLYIVCIMCRDRNTRRDAISILRTHPRREGLWDSSLIAELGIWVSDLEESGAVGEYVPENARVRVVKVDVDASAKTAQVICMRKASAHDANPVFQETTVSWGY